MEIVKRNGPPEDLIYFDDELPLEEKHVEDVIEIFNTPLTGAYNWDYTVAENRIKRLLMFVVKHTKNCSPEQI